MLTAKGFNRMKKSTNENNNNKSKSDNNNFNKFKNNNNIVSLKEYRKKLTKKTKDERDLNFRVPGIITLRPKIKVDKNDIKRRIYSYFYYDNGGKIDVLAVLAWKHYLPEINQTVLAKKLKITRASIHYWKKTGVPNWRLAQVCEETGIPPHLLRPDLYPDFDEIYWQ